MRHVEGIEHLRTNRSTIQKGEKYRSRRRRRGRGCRRRRQGEGEEEGKEDDLVRIFETVEDVWRI